MLLLQVYRSDSIPCTHVLLRLLVSCRDWGKTHEEDMMILNHFALVLLIACVAQQVLVINCEKGQGRKGKRDGKGKDNGSQGPPPAKPPVASTGSEGQVGKGALKGKFSTKDKTQCTWQASGQDRFTIAVVCEKGGVGFNCEYTARPAACPQYASGAKTYWKQIARALKKQKNICQDANTLVKAGMCKKAPRDAHFKLSISTPAPPRPETTTPPPSDNKTCSDKADKQKLAEEYCSSSWVSLCNFFFSMIQNEDC
ncbi:fibroblast growth factor-binding protein 1-like [Megalops cyprinoides]|uniref:fibroblast growth factor-binding protein 1-like n=1 Tax=Megalops cyprinoides TaxID=118141 RepID=UPI0018655A12|nr:fibroblast growth factor-binding protein 1-like [Megalops cyprinoides]